MAITEKDLLAGIQLLPELIGIDTEAALRERVKVCLPEALPTERETQHDIKTVIEQGISNRIPGQVRRIVGAMERHRATHSAFKGVVERGISEDLPGQVTRIVDALYDDEEPYWHQVWILLYHCKLEIIRLELNPATTIDDVQTLFRDVRTGVSASREREFTDAENRRRLETLRQGTGWCVALPRRKTPLRRFVKAQVEPAEYELFADLFSEVQPGQTDPKAALQQKRDALSKCLEIEGTYWNRMK